MIYYTRNFNINSDDRMLDLISYFYDVLKFSESLTNEQNKHEISAVLCVFRLNFPKCLKFLLSKKGSIFFLKKGIPVPILACHLERINDAATLECAQILISAGTDVNSPFSYFGFQSYILHEHLGNNYEFLVNFLLQNGANPRLTRNGNSAFAIAVTYHFSIFSIKKFLTEKFFEIDEIFGDENDSVVSFSIKNKKYFFLEWVVHNFKSTGTKFVEKNSEKKFNYFIFRAKILLGKILILSE